MTLQLNSHLFDSVKKPLSIVVEYWIALVSYV